MLLAQDALRRLKKKPRGAAIIQNNPTAGVVYKQWVRRQQAQQLLFCECVLLFLPVRSMDTDYTRGTLCRIECMYQHMQ